VNIGDWLAVICEWLVVIGYWSLVIGWWCILFWSFVNDREKFEIFPFNDNTFFLFCKVRQISNNN